jgi:membrane protein
MIEASQDTGTSLIAAALGIGALLFGATGVFIQLQDALNTMWEVSPKPNRGIMGMIRERFLSFAMVVGVGFLLLVSLVVSAGLAALEGYLVGLLPQMQLIMQIVSYLISFAVITLIFALVFKYVPDAEIDWRDVWWGAAFTALLFTLGQIGIGLYLGNTDFTAQYGTAGALVVILLWIYYSAMISFFGAEFTQVYANRYGSRVVAADNAVPLTREARAQQGLPRQEELETAQQHGLSVEEAGGMVPATGVKGKDSGQAVDRSKVQPVRMDPNPWEKPPALDPNPLRRSSVERPEERSLRAFSAISMILVGLTGGFFLGRSGKKKR